MRFRRTHVPGCSTRKRQKNTEKTRHSGHWRSMSARRGDSLSSCSEAGIFSDVDDAICVCAGRFDSRHSKGARGNP